jgi:hypothetical protein
MVLPIRDFGELLKIVKNLLPEDNQLPSSTYEEKKGHLPFRIGGTEDTCMP